jgi:hypothetical protein
LEDEDPALIGPLHLLRADEAATVGRRRLSRRWQIVYLGEVEDQAASSFPGRGALLKRSPG